MAEQLRVNFEFRANQTFNDFFDGGNEEVIMHLQRCVEEEGEQQVFIWGAHGLGKSHLLQACCHYAYSLKQQAFYYSFPKTNLPDPALMVGLDKFDLVCLDDIDHIAGDPVWERAFFTFFNQHRSDNHRLIMSSSLAPLTMMIELPDLKTRINWGLALKLKEFTEPESINALIFKAKRMGFEITPQVSAFLIKHHAKNWESIWILLNKLDEASLSANRKLTLPFLKKILAAD